jgi:glycosyltransferase involved in cell wall biosynthesis
MIYKSVETVCGKRNCMTICCSEGEYRESLHLTKRSAYINNGIDVSELSQILRNAKKEDNHEFTVYTLGRICYQKNPVLFNQIALAMPDVHFQWIGDGELREELTAPNVNITGWTKRDEALKYSMQGDVFLLTSLWEGLPMSLLESMYMRKLCVVNDTIGNSDVIHSGDNGFVCHDIDEFVRAIRRAQNGNVDELIEKAYRDIIEEYNTNTMAEKYSRIYEVSLSEDGDMIAKKFNTLINNVEVVYSNGNVSNIALRKTEISK